MARELEMRREQWEMQVAGVASAVDLGRALVSAIENIASTHSMGKDRDTIVHVEAPAVVDGPTIGQAVKEGIVEGLRRPAAPNLEPTPQPSASPSSLPESSFRIDGGFLRTSHIQPRVDADVARVDHKFVQDILIESNPYLRHEVVTDSIELVTFSQTSMVSEDEALQMRDTPLLISNQQSQATYSSLSSFQGARVGARALTSRSLRAQNGRFTPIVSALVEHAATLAVVGMTNQSLFGSPASSYSGSSPVPESSLLTIGEQVICGENSSLALPSESLSEEAKTDLHPNVSIPELFTRPNNNEPINSPAVLGSQLEEGDSVMEEGLHSPAPSTNSRPHRYSPDSQAESGSGSDAEADYSIVTEA